MKKVALVYASLYGQTEKIARQMRLRLESKGLQACLMNVEDSKNEEFPESVDAVIVGCPVYFDTYPSSFLEWIPRHRDFILSKPHALFSVSMNAATSTAEARRKDVLMLQKLIQKTGLRPRFLASFQGGLNFSDYNWFLRLAMKRISRRHGFSPETNRDYEFTDWKAVDSFVTSFAADDLSSPFTTERRLKSAENTDLRPGGYEPQPVPQGP